MPEFTDSVTGDTYRYRAKWNGLEWELGWFQTHHGRTADGDPADEYEVHREGIVAGDVWGIDQRGLDEPDAMMFILTHIPTGFRAPRSYTYAQAAQSAAGRLTRWAGGLERCRTDDAEVLVARIAENAPPGVVKAAPTGAESA